MLYGQHHTHLLPRYKRGISLSLLLASGPATHFQGIDQAEGKERRGPEGEREEREIGTNPGGWRYNIAVLAQPPGDKGCRESTAEQTK